MDENEIRRLLNLKFQDVQIMSRGSQEPITVDEFNEKARVMKKALTDVLIELEKRRYR